MEIETSRFDDFATIEHGSPIEAVIPSDFNYDGMLDFLLVSADSGRTKSYLQLYLRNQEKPYFGKKG